MIDPDTLARLRCPENHRPLQMAAPADVAQINQRIAAGSIKTRGGRTVTDPVDGALIRDDRKVAYPIRKQIPILLIEEAIPV
jgi:uncharacterized protein YbaR (Trm112 family)